MYGYSAGRKAVRNLKNASPGRSRGRRRGAKAGPPQRLIDVDLVPSTTRYSRLMDSRDRAARALAPLWALVFIAGLVVAFLISRG